jgi:hypothetical protein
MKAIYDSIARLEAERARIDGHIAGLREALRLHSGESQEPVEAEPRKRQRRGSLKETVLSLLEEVGDKGLTTEQCITIAKSKGIELVPGSVSSLLSRLKTDDILFFDGQVYRLKRYAGPRQAA